MIKFDVAEVLKQQKLSLKSTKLLPQNYQ